VVVKLASDHTSPLVRREVAAWKVAECLSWQFLVPVTVVREFDSFAGKAKSTEASVQAFIEGAIDRPDLSLFSDDDCWYGAAFDAIVKPGDRGKKEGGGNWLGVRDELGTLRLKLIDHEHSFAYGARLSVFYNLKRSELIPPPILQSLQRLGPHLAAGSPIGQLIGRGPAEKLLGRLRQLLEGNRLDLSPLA
jgi:hypothetical protein